MMIKEKHHQLIIAYLEWIMRVNGVMYLNFYDIYKFYPS